MKRQLIGTFSLSCIFAVFLFLTLDLLSANINVIPDPVYVTSWTIIAAKDQAVGQHFGMTLPAHLPDALDNFINTHNFSVTVSDILELYRNYEIPSDYRLGLPKRRSRIRLYL